MGVTADVLAVVGVIGMMIGHLWMAALAFRTSVWLGLSCTYFAPAFALAAIVGSHRPPVTMRPFWIWLGSGSLLLTGLALGAPVYI